MNNFSAFKYLAKLTLRGNNFSGLETEVMKMLLKRDKIEVHHRHQKKTNNSHDGTYPSFTLFLMKNSFS